MSKNKKHKLVEDQSVLDVVIPVYSNYEFVEKTLEFIRQSAGQIKYSVYLTDDCSPDYKEVGIPFWKKIRESRPEVKNVFIHKVNMGYGKSVNDSAILGRAPNLLILNSDVLILGQSLEFMITHLNEQPDVSIVFPKLLFFPNSTQPNKPAGKIQHCGVVFDIRGNPYHNHIGWDADHPFVNTIKDYNACTGACFMIRRETWRHLRGFDLTFERGYYEDIDLCLRVRTLGKKIRYLPMCIGYHFTNASTDRFTVEAFGGTQNIERNNFIFHQKWGDKIPYDQWIYAAT